MKVQFNVSVATMLLSAMPSAFAAEPLLRGVRFHDQAAAAAAAAMKAKNENTKFFHEATCTANGNSIHCSDLGCGDVSGVFPKCSDGRTATAECFAICQGITSDYECDRHDHDHDYVTGDKCECDWEDDYGLGCIPDVGTHVSEDSFLDHHGSHHEIDGVKKRDLKVLCDCLHHKKKKEHCDHIIHGMELAEEFKASISKKQLRAVCRSIKMESYHDFEADFHDHDQAAAAAAAAMKAKYENTKFFHEATCTANGNSIHCGDRGCGDVSGVFPKCSDGRTATAECFAICQGITSDYECDRHDHEHDYVTGDKCECNWEDDSGLGCMPDVGPDN